MAERKLVRPWGGRKLGGVCAGIALRYGYDVTWVRVAFVIAGLLGIGIVTYLVMWAVVPDGEFHTPDEKTTDYGQDPGGGDDPALQMDGWRVRRGPYGI